MIIVPLQGGLGNQMFQYAFGRGVSTSLDRRLVLDLTMLPTGKREHRRSYGLDALPIRPDVLRLGMGRDARGNGLMSASGRSARRLLRRRTLVESESDALVHLEEIPRGLAICAGYWQSPAYFEGIRTEIRRELTPAVPAGGRAALVLDRAGDTQLIAVHVRRGDYVQRRGVSAFHGSRSADYFRRAVHSIVERTGDRVCVVVLSDDPAWADANLQFEVRTIHAELDHPLPTVEALAVMSRCQHHVIANSSFSWWGAWLAAWEGQHVIHPEPWFLGREVDRGFRFPPHWEAFRDHPSSHPEQ